MSLPYFPMYAQDYDGDTGHLSLLEDGVFSRLLRLCWRSPWCRVPNDDKWLFRQLRARTEDEQHAVRSVVDEFFVVKGQHLVNRRLYEEWEKAHVAHSKRVSAGQRGGLAKARNRKANSPSNAKAMLKQCSSNQNQNHKDNNTTVGSVTDARPRAETVELAKKMKP